MRLLSPLILTIPFPVFSSILFLSSLQMKARHIRPQRGHYGFGVQTLAPYSDGCFGNDWQRYLSIKQNSFSPITNASWNAIRDCL